MAIKARDIRIAVPSKDDLVLRRGTPYSIEAITENGVIVRPLSFLECLLYPYREWRHNRIMRRVSRIQ